MSDHIEEKPSLSNEQLAALTNALLAEHIKSLSYEEHSLYVKHLLKITFNTVRLEQGKEVAIQFILDLLKDDVEPPTIM